MCCVFTLASVRHGSKPSPVLLLVTQAKTWQAKTSETKEKHRLLAQFTTYPNRLRTSLRHPLLAMLSECSACQLNVLVFVCLCLPLHCWVKAWLKVVNFLLTLPSLSDESAFGHESCVTISQTDKVSAVHSLLNSHLWCIHKLSTNAVR